MNSRTLCRITLITLFCSEIVLIADYKFLMFSVSSWSWMHRSRSWSRSRSRTGESRENPCLLTGRFWRREGGCPVTTHAHTRARARAQRDMYVYVCMLASVLTWSLGATCASLAVSNLQYVVAVYTAHCRLLVARTSCSWLQLAACFSQYLSIFK